MPEEVVHSVMPDLELLDAYDRGRFEEVRGTLEDRAAHLLYEAVQERSPAEGAAALAQFWDQQGRTQLPESTLAILTLLVTTAQTEQKDQILGVIRAMLAACA